MVVVILPSLQSGGTEWQTLQLLREISRYCKVCLWIYDAKRIDERVAKAFTEISNLDIFFGVSNGFFKLLSLRPKVILSYAINYYIPEIALRLFTSAILITERRNLYHWLKSQPRRSLQEALRNSLTHTVVCNSQAVADMVRRNEPDVADRLCVFHNSVAPFLLVTEPKRQTVVAVGNIKSGKGVERVLRIYQELEAEAHARGLQFALYGRCDDASLLADLDPSFVKRVYRGLVAKETIFNDAFCLLHLSEAEGFPNAVLEATACGVVPILSDIAPHRELFAECSILVSDDVAAMHALRQALDWPGREHKVFEELSQRCRNIAAQFTPERRAKRYLDLFDACLN